MNFVIHLHPRRHPVIPNPLIPIFPVSDFVFSSSPSQSETVVDFTIHVATISRFFISDRPDYRFVKDILRYIDFEIKVLDIFCIGLLAVVNSAVLVGGDRSSTVLVMRGKAMKNE
jgi:hypothetical protein